MNQQTMQQDASTLCEKEPVPPLSTAQVRAYLEPVQNDIRQVKDSYNQYMNSAQQTINQLENRLKQEDVPQLKSYINYLETKYEKVTMDLELANKQAQIELQKWEYEHGRVKDQLQTAQQQRSSATALSEQLRDGQQQFKNELDAAKEREHKLQASVESLTAELLRKTETIDSLQVQLKEAQLSCTELQAQIDLDKRSEVDLAANQVDKANLASQHINSPNHAGGGQKQAPKRHDETADAIAEQQHAEPSSDMQQENNQGMATLRRVSSMPQLSPAQRVEQNRDNQTGTCANQQPIVIQSQHGGNLHQKTVLVDQIQQFRNERRVVLSPEREAYEYRASKRARVSTTTIEVTAQQTNKPSCQIYNREEYNRGCSATDVIEQEAVELRYPRTQSCQAERQALKPVNVQRNVFNVMKRTFHNPDEPFKTPVHPTAHDCATKAEVYAIRARQLLAESRHVSQLNSNRSKEQSQLQQVDFNSVNDRQHGMVGLSQNVESAAKQCVRNAEQAAKYFRSTFPTPHPSRQDGSYANEGHQNDIQCPKQGQGGNREHQSNDVTEQYHGPAQEELGLQRRAQMFNSSEQMEPQIFKSDSDVQHQITSEGIEHLHQPTGFQWLLAKVKNLPISQQLDQISSDDIIFQPLHAGKLGRVNMQRIIFASKDLGSFEQVLQQYFTEDQQSPIQNTGRSFLGDTQSIAIS